MSAGLNTERESPLKRWAPILVILWLAVYWFLFFTSRLPNSSNSQGSLYRSDVVFMLPEIYASLAGDPASTTSGLQYLPQRFWPAVLAAFIVGSSFSLGNLILRGLKLTTGIDKLSQIAIAGGIGLSATSLLTLTLGVAGLLSRPLFVAIFLLINIAECWFEYQHRKQKKPVPAEHAFRPHPMMWVCLIVAVPFLWCMLLGSLLPPTDFDVKEYHLGGPKEYFLTGSVHFLPHNVYTSFPFLTEMLLLVGMVLYGGWEQGALVGQAVLMAFAPTTALGVYAVARRLSGEAAGWLAALIYLTIPWTYRISIIAYTEGALCGYVVLTLLAFFIWRDHRQSADSAIKSDAWSRWGCLVIGLLAGSAVSTKYPGMILVAIPFGLAILLTELGSFKPSTERIRSTVTMCLLYTLGVLITFGPWMLKNLVETGNPVYPLLYSLFGGADWNAELQAKWKDAHPSLLFKPGWGDVRGVLYENDWQSPLLFGLAPLALVFQRKRGIVETAGFAFLLFAMWYLFTHRIDRFWVPMNSVMAVLAGCGLVGTLGLKHFASTRTPVESQKKKQRKQTAVPQTDPAGLLKNVVVVSLVAGAIVYNFAFITTAKCGFNGYLMDYKAAREQTLTRSIAVVEAMNLPPDAKVLFVGEAEIFDARFPYAYCTVFDKNLLEEWTSRPDGNKGWTLLSQDEILTKLREEKITHVFVNWNEILRYRTTYRFTDFVSPDRMQQFVDAGILSPIVLPDQEVLRPWESVDASWQQEIDRWGPELKLNYGNIPAMLQFQAYRVAEPE
ncbi:ArnT family glycosyltransferase [Planctomicrobium sp. SH527]|uniref:ArnT family glycosyltransferase n=1 Tax=Planctomicrobium sp. SH527 TaxID=3448123 RepID=UPI003F5C521F